jgi:hypothetical protein
METTLEITDAVEGTTGAISLTEGTTDAISLTEITLDQLAADIKREHQAAEYSVRDSLMHARAAGVKLIEVKARLPYGKFMSWVRTHCEFSHPTANLYMKVAKCWDTLGDSQQVTNLTLRQAGELLYMDPSDEDAEATADLINLKLLDWPDLAGLDPLTVRALVKEVRSYFEDVCMEPDEAVAAKRAALPEEWEPGWALNRGAIRTDARRVASQLKDGKCSRGKLRQHLRIMERGMLRAKVKETTPSGEKPVPHFEAYVDRMYVFIAETHALFEPYGLLRQRLTLSVWQRDRLVKLIADVKQALDELEEQAQAAPDSPPETDLPDAEATEAHDDPQCVTVGVSEEAEPVGV